MTFSVHGEEFLLNGEPFRLLGGAIHYFRIPKEYWRDRLLKLKECGLNTVETYVPWNAHEPVEGTFCFDGMLDLGAFLDIAAELGLYAIVRPGPYICAEWEGGGLPAWLLTVPGMQIRCDNGPYLEKVQTFFEHLFPILIPRLCTNGGNILMLQVENEYGSYGNDKDYLRKLEKLYSDLGADCLLYRSDGDDPIMMHGAETGIYAADNFGSDPIGHKKKMEALGYSAPFFCGEYWCGWFDHWHETHHRRSAQNVADEVETFLQIGGHLNFYMFCGGTNFGFWNGANDLPGDYAPTTTGYDYDALLTEAGDRTEKYYRVREVLQKHFPVPELTATESKKQAYGRIPFCGTAELFAPEHLSEVQKDVYEQATPLTMEETGSYLGYTLYETDLSAPHGTTLVPEPIADRCSIYLDGKPLGVLEHGRVLHVPEIPAESEGRLSILCENTGRVNYGPRTLDSKGLRSVRAGQQFLFGWRTTALPMEDLSRLTFEPFHETDRPAFHRAVLSIDGEPADTFLSMRGFHKGFVTVNGINIGRYYTDAGPQYTLYVPAPFLRPGDNEIILFESERTDCASVEFVDAPDYGE
ncbi:MAG: beta-galactosidase [Oscillospiraceae bacterium]|nr:beta-galactosidase [Oscillospiraceae bacterium]